MEKHTYITIFILNLIHPRLQMLYFVPTPIWNKEDITLRAIRLLKEIDILICEDTRTAKKLLSMYNISITWKDFFSITSFSSQWKLKFFAKLLQENDAVVISEAWTPWLSDPWKSLIQLCNENQIQFSVLPGANALIPSIVAAGFDTTEFTFIWFLPQKKWRLTALKDIIERKNPTFFYESVHRMTKLLEELKSLNFDWKIFIAREISKVFEQFFTWSLSECEEFIKSWKIVIKWEFVIGLSNK
jgi:16S rRNA (cytidine1402-2'-O)-methyltransferase